MKLDGLVFENVKSDLIREATLKAIEALPEDAIEGLDSGDTRRVFYTEGKIPLVIITGKRVRGDHLEVKYPEDSTHKYTKNGIAYFRLHKIDYEIDI